MKLFYFFLFTLVACGQECVNSDDVISPEARKLNDSAVRIFQLAHKDSFECAKAIALLDRATALDSNYYLAYINKSMFQCQNKQFDQALLTAKQLLRLAPNAPDSYTRIGILYEFKGDSISSLAYFQKADDIYKSVVDTTKDKLQYDGHLLSKGMNLILLRKEKEGREILARVYNEQIDPGTKSAMKEGIDVYMNKSRGEIIEFLKENKQGK